MADNIAAIAEVSSQCATTFPHRNTTGAVCGILASGAQVLGRDRAWAMGARTVARLRQNGYAPTETGTHTHTHKRGQKFSARLFLQLRCPLVNHVFSKDGANAWWLRGLVGLTASPCCLSLPAPRQAGGAEPV